MATNAEARFAIPIEVDGVEDAEAAASALENLREKVTGGTERLKELSAAFRRLRGTTVEVSAAKKELAAKMQAERDAISSAQLKILQASNGLDQLAAKTKKAAGSQKEFGDKLKATKLDEAKTKTASFGNAVKFAGGPVSSLREKIGQLSDLAGPSGLGTALNVATAATVGLVAAVVALTAGVIGGAIALGKWILGSANAARSAGLLREAWAGSARNAANLGTQIDALATKVPTSKAALNDLSIALMKNGLQGQTLVDTFNAVGQASAALGDDAGAKLRELVERGRLSQRFAVNPLELQGSGLEFGDIAQSLAKNLKISMKDAQSALAEGRVRLGDGAKALRDAVEGKFAGLNLRKMLDFNVLVEKAKETLASLASGIKLDELGKEASKFFDLFDDSKSVTGVALRELVTLVGNGLVGNFRKGGPIAQQFFKGLVIGALKLTIGVLELRKKLLDTFRGQEIIKGVTLMTVALEAGRFVVFALATTVALAAAGLALFVVNAVLVVSAVKSVYQSFVDAKNAIGDISWDDIGLAIVDGITGGLLTSGPKIVDAVKGLASKIKGTFTDALQIQSPSKVFARYGRNIPEGTAEGIEDGIPKVAQAIDDMAPTPRAGGVASAVTKAGGGGAPNVNVTINAPGATKEAVDAMSEDAFLSKLTKAIVDALASRGGAVEAT